MGLENRPAIFSQLQTDIVRLQRCCPSQNKFLDLGLGPLRESFPDGSFPLGAIHEFISSTTEDTAATAGFISGLLSSLMGPMGITFWISSSRTLFPPALKMLGASPERFVFVDVRSNRDVVWAMDEALKCGALSAVIGEMRDITFTESRRLQLAVEESKVTGFVLRHTGVKPTTTACVSRWKVTALPSDSTGELPGIGFPKWKVELLRMRNGKPGTWHIRWQGRMFGYEDIQSDMQQEQNRKAG